MRSTETTTEKIRAFAYQAWRSLVGIGARDPRTGDLCTGSGVAVRLGQEYFIATALHVCEREKREKNFSHVRVVAGRRRYAATPPKIEEVLWALDDWHDCVVLRLDREWAEALGADWIDLDRAPPAHQFDSVVLTGFPGQWREFLAGPVPSLSMNAVTVEAAIVDDPTFIRPLAAEYRPEHEFFVTYDPDQLTGHGVEETIPRPEGISGCAVFTVPTGEDGAVWSPSITRVIGIVTHHLPRLRLLRVKRFDVWAGIIRRHCENHRR